MDAPILLFKSIESIVKIIFPILELVNSPFVKKQKRG